MLDVADLSANPHASGFGEYGLCRVPFGSASRGSPPKRRSVLTVWPWLPGVLEQWIEDPPAVRRSGSLAGVVAVRTRAAGRGQRAEQAV